MLLLSVVTPICVLQWAPIISCNHWSTIIPDWLLIKQTVCIAWCVQWIKHTFSYHAHPCSWVNHFSAWLRSNPFYIALHIPKTKGYMHFWKLQHFSFHRLKKIYWLGFISFISLSHFNWAVFTVFITITTWIVNLLVGTAGCNMPALNVCCFFLVIINICSLCFFQMLLTASGSCWLRTWGVYQWIMKILNVWRRIFRKKHICICSISQH